MSNISDWIKQELYPTLFNSIDRAFLEHNFTRFSGGWKSNTYLDGTTHKRIDKTVITRQATGSILEQGGKVLSLVDYVMERDGSTFIEAVKTLANVVNLEVPRGEFNPELYQRIRDKEALLEDCNSYFMYCLKSSPGAKEVKDYLINRGYTEADVEDMELGYIPSQEKLFKYLEKKEYSKSLIEETIKLNDKIGGAHKLSIPFRSGGTLKGFKFRAIGDVTPKYLNSTGLDRVGGFFNLLGIKGDKDIVIVEGELDSLIATARGVDNVVATGGNSVNSEQIEDAIKRGAKKFTICLDAEPGKEESTFKKVNSIIQVILEEGVNRVYVVNLPSSGVKVDPDSLIKDKGVEAFKEAIKEATEYYNYYLDETLKKYLKVEEREGVLHPKELDNLLDEIVVTASSILDPMDRDRYKKRFTSFDAIQAIGITEEALSLAEEKLTTTREKEKQNREFQKLLSEASTLQKKGETPKAIELLEREVKEVKVKDRQVEFSKYLIPSTREGLIEAFKDEKESIETGYTIAGEKLLLPSGALSFIVAPTSHGKTTMLINLALGVVEKGLQKNRSSKVFFFSYEEHDKEIRANFLNAYVGRNSDKVMAKNCRRSIKHYLKTGSPEMIKAEFIEDFLNLQKRYFSLEESGKININYSSYTTLELVDLIRYLHKNTEVEAIFIDYIQLLKLGTTKHKTYSRQEEVKEVCTALKDIAVETGLPIVVAGQFNRQVQNHLQLHLNNIGEAGDIERVANLILAMWNNNFKIVAKEEETRKIATDNLQRENTLYVEILKNREGEVGLTDFLDWNGNTRTIKNITITDPLCTIQEAGSFGASGVKQTLPEPKKLSF